MIPLLTFLADDVVKDDDDGYQGNRSNNNDGGQHGYIQAIWRIL